MVISSYKVQQKGHATLVPLHAFVKPESEEFLRPSHCSLESDTLDENDDKDAEMVQERRRKQKAKQKSGHMKRLMSMILSKGFFGMMHALVSRDSKIPSFAQSRVSPETQRNSELQTSDSSSSYTSSVELQQPTLSLLNSLFSSVTTALERAAEEKSLLLNKIRDINELSMQEVDEIINMCVRQDSVSSSDNIQKKAFVLTSIHEDIKILKWLLVVLQTEDEDMIYMYNAYLHKLITCFLSNPLARDKLLNYMLVRSSNNREACQTILSFLFAHGMNDIDDSENTAIRTVNKSKEKDHICKPGTGSISLADWVSERGAMVGTGCHDHPVKQGKDIPTDDQERTKCTLVVLELLEIIQFRCPDSTAQLSNIVAGMKYDLQAEDILGKPGNSGKGGVYYYSERGDWLIDLASVHDKLWQLLRWGWKYNKNLEEQAAQLHMLTAWSQIVEVSASRRLTMLEDRSEILFQVLDASLSASASPDCSLKMAFILSQVALTCMAKLRDERFLFPGSLSSDNITCLDLIVVKQLSNGACLTILFKLIMEILRNESSEALRRRQYALLLSYFQYCQNVVDPDVPTTVLQFLLLNEQDNKYIDLPKIEKEQAELARANFSTLRKEAQSVLNLVIKDATHGSELGETISYVIDALISIDHECYFLNQHQSRGFLRSCFTAISNICNQMACTFEAEFALLLRISHKYGKSGAQVLFSMGMLEHLASGRAINLQSELLYFLVTKKSLRLQPSDSSSSYTSSVELQQPTLSLLNSLFSSVTTALERAAEEKSLLLNKEVILGTKNGQLHELAVNDKDKKEKNALAFERAYELDLHGEKDWFANTELKSGIYAWIVQAEDYKMNNIIGEHNCRRWMSEQYLNLWK
ncbi:hypothetical protein VNO78_02636 [Psophocarpus tetragonolobus]|uniref:Uncharacterized protein n=1 Tax=Psophocarpus tetragonolobus TaxID=3891 RepID=A0AAN9T1M4_PSOTE